MKILVVIATILLVTVFFSGCGSALIAKKEAGESQIRVPDPVNNSIFIAARASSILRRIPEPVSCIVGSQRHMWWEEFTRQQHDDLTIDALLHLYCEASDQKVRTSDESVRMQVIKALSRQKNARLLPLWQQLLVHRDKVDLLVAWNALFGLATINTPQSNSVILSLLSDPGTPPDILSSICYLFAEEIPAVVGSEQIIAELTGHSSEDVRHAAFEAMRSRPGKVPVQLLGRAFTDPSPKIVLWALRSFSFNRNLSPELFLLKLKCLNHADASVRAYADKTLSSLLWVHAENKYEKFEMCRQAFEAKRWNYQTAPLLTLRYALILEENKGELAEAEKAYKTAQRAYRSNSTYQAFSFNGDPGATMLYRLIQIKLERGDIKGAIEALNQLVKEYPLDTVRPLEAELRPRLEKALSGTN